jgi:hypothetical protein
MPQASDELRTKMEEYFGDPINDWGPTKYLLDAGYLEKGGWWRKPTSEHVVTEKEQDCLNFLCDEWDHCYDFRKKS